MEERGPKTVSDPPPTDEDPDNFTWSTDIVLQVEGLLIAEVPKL